MTDNNLQIEVSDTIMLGFSYLEAYATNDVDRQRLFAETYNKDELLQALLMAYDQTLWAHALARNVSMPEYLAQTRDYLLKFTETVRTADAD